MPPGDYVEDVLIEQPAIELFGKLGWNTANAYRETFGPTGSLGRETDQDVMLARPLRTAMHPAPARAGRAAG